MMWFTLLIGVAMVVMVSIAAAALYLASEDADYISGVNLVVDGAWATTGYPDLRPFVSSI